MKTVSGDLIELAKLGAFDVIVHGCNCFHTMGAGIAKTIRTEFPAAYEADVRLTRKGDKLKLGCYTKAVVPVVRGELMIINGYTQFDYRRGANCQSPVDYEAIRQVFYRLCQALKPGVRVGIPRIGAGLAGGDWSMIKAIIDEETQGMDVTLVEY